MLLLVSTDSRTEPRFQVSDGDRTAQVFGLDVEALAPGRDVVVDASVLGYPLQSLGDLRPGEYWVQGLLHVYETFKRSDGHTVKLPPDRGEGQQWSSAPGNFYSTPVKMRIDPSSAAPLRISLDKKIRAAARSSRHQVREAHQDSKRAADEVLGPADLPRRARHAAGGMGFASGRSLSAGDLPRTFSDRGLRVAGKPARREAAGARSRQHRDLLSERPRGRALRQVWLRSDAAGSRIRVLQAVDRAGLPARDHGHDSAREPVLRRLLRGELGESRSLRRRHHLRADSLHRAEVPRSRTLGARAVRRLDRRLGSAWRAALLSRSVQRRLGQLSGPD